MAGATWWHACLACRSWPMLRDPMAVQSWGQGGTRRRLLRGVVALPWLSAMGAGAAWAARPARIVSLGGALTEVVYLLGAQGQLVGTDTTSLFPEAALKTAKVGYMRQLSAEGLLSLKPDAVVGTTEAGPPVVLDQVRSAGVRVELVQADHTWDEVRRKVATVGRVAGREREAQALHADLDSQWAAVQKVVAAATRRPRAIFILSHGGSPMVAGTGTAADALIRFVGATNAITQFAGYRPLTAEAMASAAPEVLLNSTQGIEALGGEAAFWKRPELALPPAFRRKALVGLAFVWASTRGAYAIAPAQLWQVLLQAVGAAPSAEQAPEYLVFINIRLPRLLMGVAAGAGLGLAGALMQGLFRNPLADPGLVGVSSGAALAAADGGTRMGLMLLAGVAVNALALAGLGYLNFISTDEQLRNLQMWLLGSLGGARWSAVALVGAIVAVACGLGLALARPLNAVALGEARVPALAVGAVTAATGIIGFIGLVAPHWVRLVAGPDHRVVLPGSALLGAALVLAADGVARTLVQPAELPLGVLTAFIGVPLFLAMLRQFRSKV